MPECSVNTTNQSEKVVVETTQVLVKEKRRYTATVTQILVRGNPELRIIDADDIKKTFMQKLEN